MSTKKDTTFEKGDKTTSQLQNLSEENEEKDQIKENEKKDDDIDGSDSDLEHLSRQLTLLNEESGSIATPIHKSNQQKHQEMVKKEREGVKKRNSPYKSPAKEIWFLSGKRHQEKSKVNLLIFTRQEPEGDLENSDSDSDDEDRWQIMEDSETEIDKALEDRAQKNHLTARNVKSILHQVITNEDVVAMVRNTLMKDQGEEIEPGQAVYEPKMTRSKVKQTIEENGQVLHPWPLTPLKKKQQKKTFLDMELTDSEADSDADFDPTLQPSSLSDEDSESLASSHLSEFGSPSTPATPRSTAASVSDLDKTPSIRGEGDQVILSPMGPPSTPFAHKKSLGRKFQEAMAENDRVQEEENIARRTRSKVSLEDTSILDLEANFVPPDFTPDMYDTECYLEDDIYRGFLTSLIKPPENENTNDTVDDEENDPEFNILDELDKLDKIKEVTKKDREKDEMRNDRGVQVSKKEMNQLMDELFQFYEETADWEEEDNEDVKRNVTITKNQLKKKWSETGYDSTSEDLTNIMCTSQRQQLADQMRKHVQLLTQTFILASGNPDQYCTIAKSSQVLLNELHTFKVQNSTFMTSNSAYCASNLDDATELVNEDREWDSTLSQKTKSRFDPNLAKVLPELSPQQKDLIWKSSVFIYPELLPSFSYLRQKAAPQRVVFTESEDNLIALGLEQFSAFPLYKNLIQKFLLPVKTPEQIKIRIKNLACAKATDNAVKFYKTKKRLPPFPRFTGKFDTEDMTAPRHQNIHSLPHWCKEMKIEEILGVREDGSDVHGIIQRSRSVPLVTADKIVMEEEKSNSAPATPLTQSSSMGNRPTPGLAARKLITDTPSGLFSSPVIYTPIKTPVQTPDVLVTPECQISDQNLSKKTSIDAQDTKSSSRTSLNFGDDLPPLVTAVSNPSKNSVSVNEVEGSLLNLEDFMPDENNQSNEAMLSMDTKGSVKETSSEMMPEKATSQKDSVTSENLSNSNRTVNSTSNSITITPNQTVHSNTEPLNTNASQKVHSFSASPTTTSSPVKNVLSLTQSGSKLIMSIAESDRHMDSQSSIVVCDDNRIVDSPAAPPSHIIAQSEDAQRNIEPCDGTESQEIKNSDDLNMSNDESAVASPACAADTSMTDVGATNSTINPVADSEILHDKVTQSNSAVCLTKGATIVPSEVKLPALDNIPPVKSALEIVASYAKYMVSPTKNVTLCQRSQETTPKKKTPTRYRPLAPKPITSPIRPVRPIFEKKSPRRQQLQRKAQAICPKGLVVKTAISPSKKAADIIMNKVLRRGNRRILPKPPHMPSPQLTIRTRSSSRRQLEMTNHETDEENMETNSECDTVGDSEYLSDDVLDDVDKYDTKDHKSFRHHRLSESGRSVESDDLQSDNDDSQIEDNDEELMADLMTASTTIGFSQKKPSINKYKRRKEIALSLVAPNIIEDDPLADDRDTSFAQAYLAMARDTLKNDLGVYEQFLRVLCELGKGEQSPVKVWYIYITILDNSYH
ncbi:hypothetical protein FSP39_008314 [Pinctada imbricata]|uniref:GON-4-like protein n=1 Tax=Pinctada imbricata TaxID=66713 RepID=A0AA88Y2S7_PINIB|nr:hypothetical protein FSP39_008314 [Pinctada imbricata]